MPKSRLSRRKILQTGSLGILSAIAGCSNGLNSDSDTPTATLQHATETRTSSPTATVTATGPLSVGRVTVWPQVVAMSFPDSIATYGDRDEQYVLAVVGGDGPDYEAISLRAGSEVYPSAENPGGYASDSLRTEDDTLGRYTGSGTGYVLFSVPKPLDADVVRLEWDETENAPGTTAAAQHVHDLPTDIGPVLARPPASFEMRAFDKPDDDSGTLELTVANVGDVAGTFVGALNRSGPNAGTRSVAAIRLAVEPGETASWTIDEDFDGEATYKLDWQGGRESVEVTGT